MPDARCLCRTVGKESFWCSLHQFLTLLLTVLFACPEILGSLQDARRLKFVWSWMNVNHNNERDPVIAVTEVKAEIHSWTLLPSLQDQYGLDAFQMLHSRVTALGAGQCIDLASSAANRPVATSRLFLDIPLKLPNLLRMLVCQGHKRSICDSLIMA